MTRSRPPMDGRRSPYVPIDVFVAFDDFGAKLIDKWGLEGIAAWMLLLAAAKREVNQGTFTFTTAAEGWAKLGAEATAFTLDEFITFTGRCKKTRKTRHGRITYVVITGWKRWNHKPGTPPTNPQNPRKPPKKTGKLPPASAPVTPPEVKAEQEGEGEVEAEQNEPALPDLENAGQALIKRLRLAEAGTPGRLFEILDRIEENTYDVIRAELETLPPHVIERVRSEVLAVPAERIRKSRTGLVVDLLQRENRKRAAA